MSLAGNTFKKYERLCRKKQIDELFSKGKSFYLYPFRIHYLLVPAIDNSPTKVLFSAAKKRFKKATQRNLLKRRMREAYRKNKAELNKLIPEKNQLLIAIIYSESDILTYQTIEKSMIKVVQKLFSEYI